MSTMSLGIITLRSHRRPRWSQVTQGLAEWRRRARSRSELMNLSDADLRDIGITRCSAAFEAAKPFWMAMIDRSRPEPRSRPTVCSGL